MEIQNKSIQTFLQVRLNKPIGRISLADIEQVEEISCQVENSTLDELKQFKNLRKVHIDHSLVTREVLETLMALPQLSSLEFFRCIFPKDNSLSEFHNLSALSFYNCYIEDYQFLRGKKDLIYLSIQYPYNDAPIIISDLRESKRLQHLYFDGCLLEEDYPLDFQELSTLSVMNTYISNFTFLSALPKLKKLYVSPRYLEDPQIQRFQLRGQVISDLREISTVESIKTK